MSKRKWDLPEDSSGQSGFMEHRGNKPERGEMNDVALAEALDVGVAHAHDMIEGVTEHRTTDLDDDD